jgi:hypothetical protein
MTPHLLVTIAVLSAAAVGVDAWRSNQPHPLIWAVAVFCAWAVALPAYAAMRLLHKYPGRQHGARVVQHMQQNRRPDGPVL